MAELTCGRAARMTPGESLISAPISHDCCFLTLQLLEDVAKSGHLEVAVCVVAVECGALGPLGWMLLWLGKT